jgi:hypothetical protein
MSSTTVWLGNSVHPTVRGCHFRKEIVTASPVTVSSGHHLAGQVTASGCPRHPFAVVLPRKAPKAVGGTSGEVTGGAADGAPVPPGRPVEMPPGMRRLVDR